MTRPRRCCVDTRGNWIELGPHGRRYLTERSRHWLAQQDQEARRMTDPFRVRVATRGYEVDSNGHVAGTVLLQYGMHARWECLRAAGVDQHELLQGGLGPVSLEDSIRYHHELRAGEEVDISCTFHWGSGTTFRVQQQLHRTDGTLIAEITNVDGLLDLTDRRLVPDPGERWQSVAATPELLGL